MSIAPTALSRLARGRDTDLPETSTMALDGPALAAVVRIVELQLRQVPLDTLTAEVLPAMLRIFEVPAGALLLYRREDATLTLAAARGLSVAGAEALDVLRWGDDRSCEMPLRALVDRRVYVVERPADDAFGRRLTSADERRPLSNVAAVPLYRWQLPVGVLLLLAGEAPLTPDALLAPLFAYDVLALALSTMMWARDDRSATPLPASDTAPPPLLCLPWVDSQHENQAELLRLAAERDAAIAAARDEGLGALEAGLAAARAEDRAVRDAGIAAAREENRIVLDTMLHELRAAIAGLEAERQASASERAALGERLATVELERGLLDDQLASAEQNRSLLASRLDSLEHELTRRLEAALTASAVAPAPVARAETERPPGIAVTPAPLPPTAPPSVAAPVSSRAPTAAEAAAIKTSPSSPASPPGERRVLEANAALRTRIENALATTIPVGRGGVAVVNLVGCDAARVTEMAAAAEAGCVVVGYAADPAGGSRILGPLRCFTSPPTAAEATAAVDLAPRGNRRTITLSEDTDAFMAAKSALAKAGHSVSMAWDEKQALDLLAILRPDTVLVDLRGGGEPAVEFLDALGPETGRVLTLLVHGDPSGAVLSHLANRMLRTAALDVNELARVCRNAAPETAKRSGSAAPRTTR